MKEDNKYFKEPEAEFISIDKTDIIATSENPDIEYNQIVSTKQNGTFPIDS